MVGAVRARQAVAHVLWHAVAQVWPTGRSRRFAYGVLATHVRRRRSGWHSIAIECLWSSVRYPHTQLAFDGRRRGFDASSTARHDSRSPARSCPPPAPLRSVEAGDGLRRLTSLVYFSTGAIEMDFRFRSGRFLLAALMLGIVAPPAASAQITASGPLNVNVVREQSTNCFGCSGSVSVFSSNDFTFFWWFTGGMWRASVTAGTQGGITPAVGRLAKRFDAAEQISDAGNFGSGLSYDLGQYYPTEFLSSGFFGGQEGYLGISGACPGGICLGWIRVSAPLYAYTGDSISVLGWAYNSTPGAPILAGQSTVVPEPSTYALMAAGLASIGIAACRRRSSKES